MFFLDVSGDWVEFGLRIFKLGPIPYPILHLWSDDGPHSPRIENENTCETRENRSDDDRPKGNLLCRD